MMASGFLMKLDSDCVLLQKVQNQHNYHGTVSLKNISNFLIAIKVKSNNPSQYIVAPSQVILNPNQKAQFQFTKNGYSLTYISEKTDKFQFIAIAIDQSVIHVFNNQPRVDEKLFNQKDKINQKLILEAQFDGDYSLNTQNASRLNTQLSESSKKKSPSLNHDFQRNSASIKKITQLQSLTNGSLTDMKYGQRQSLQQSQSSTKHPGSPQFPKSLNYDKEKEFKLKYEKIIQQVHEYEKNFQQLDQEIKIAKNEKEKWNQIQNATKHKKKCSEGFESWQVLLVILVSMFLGILWAK
ncbi:hypothetical protein ABPG72_022500 [Tetrahymena utriculariae]